MSRERELAQQEATAEARRVTEELGRAHLYVEVGGSLVDVTEEVVTVMDLVYCSMDWGSNFFDDEEMVGYNYLADLLKTEKWSSRSPFKH